MFVFVMSGPVGGEFDAVAEVLRALASPLRLRILVHLSGTERAVGDLAEEIGESQPLVSQHLGILRRAGLVGRRRHGRHRLYTATGDLAVGSALSMIDHHRRNIMSTVEHAVHTDHEHVHGEGCGHVEVPHGDHVDYAHDGHLHRAHDAHWDECEPAGHSAHDAHEHVHGEDCGHVAVAHGDHLDYVHDGHRHAAHDGHWDEH